MFVGIVACIHSRAAVFCDADFWNYANHLAGNCHIHVERSYEPSDDCVEYLQVSWEWEYWKKEKMGELTLLNLTFVVV